MGRPCYLKISVTKMEGSTSCRIVVISPDKLLLFVKIGIGKCLMEAGIIYCSAAALSRTAGSTKLLNISLL